MGVAKLKRQTPEALLDTARQILEKRQPDGRQPSRRIVRSRARRIWVMLHPRQRGELARHLRATGFEGRLNWNVFLDYAFSTTPKPSEDSTRNPIAAPYVDPAPLSSAEITYTRNYILSLSQGGKIRMNSPRDKLLTLMLPLWTRISRSERAALSASLQAEGFSNKSLVENMIDYAREIIRLSNDVIRPPHPISDTEVQDPPIKTVNNIHNAYPTFEYPDRGMTGDDRLAPCCKYCGGNTLFQAGYTFCFAVETRREEWLCPNPACWGSKYPTLHQYPVSGFERRG